MMKKERIFKWTAAAVALVVAVVTCILLNKWQEYIFFYREQNQIFLFDWQDIFSKGGEIGGFALVLSQFLVQFFKLPWMGALITALIGTGAAWLIWKTIEKASASISAFPLCFLPLFLQEGALGDPMYLYQGFVAFVLAVLFLWFYSRVFSGKGVVTRIAAGIIMSVLVYWLAGPVATLLAVSIFIHDLFSWKRGWYLSAIPVAAVFVMGLLAVRFGVVKDLKMALLQDFYYEPMLHPGLYIHAPWIALPLVIALSLLSAKLKDITGKTIAAVVATVLSLVILFRIPGHVDKKYYDMLRLSHYIVVEDWDSILSDRTSRYENFLMMNVRNLALSHKGQLLERLFEYPQSGFMSLLATDETSGQNTDITVLDSHIYYQMGSTAPSQNMAFDSSVGIRYGNPAMMMRLIRTNIVWGAYDVAGKYISEMEKTWGYREEASSLRRFIGDDSAILADPELGRLRRSLVKADHFVGMDPHRDLQLILEANPEDAVAREYYLAYMLLAKDLDRLRDYIENDPGAYDSEGNLPVRLQEAVLVYSEEDEAYCREHGVTDATFSRYNAFKKKFLESGANNGNPLKDLKSFSDTFWYYFMFTKV